MHTSLLQDLTYATRQLRKSPGFTLVAVASLALGIGANTAIFQLVNVIRLKTLPVHNPSELASIDFKKGSTRAGWFSTRSARLTTAQWEQIRNQQQGFSDVMAWSAARFNLANGGEARFAEGVYVSGAFFQVLGVNAARGRTITPDDDTQACASPGVVISHAFWQREFGADPNVLSRTISLDGHTFPVIGVTPPAFFGTEVGYSYDLAVPLCVDRLLAEDKKGRAPLRHAWWLSMIGRLKPGWTIQRASAQLEAISPAVAQASLPEIYKPDLVKKYLANKIEASEGATGVSGLRRQYETPLFILMATTGLVLLIACANLANLLLARASIREREIAVRLALGASRWRLIRQLLAESLLLALAGAALGVLLAQVLTRSLVSFLNTAENPLFLGLTLDWQVLGFTAALAMLTCLLFGLMPALRATHLSPSSVMHSGGRTMTAGRERFSLRRGLVVTQVALSLVLLVGALLFVRSLRNLLTTDAGFKPEGIITVNIDFSRANYAKERRLLFDRELQDRLKSLPGVVSVGQTGFTPVSGSGWNQSVGPDNTTAAASGKISWFNRVGPDYFRTMGTRLIAGRDFTDRDTISAPKVAIVNEEFARKFFNTPNVVGRTFRQDAEAGKPEPLFQIIGVIRNTKYYEMREDFLPIAFFPIAQDAEPGPNANFVIRAQGSPSELTRTIKTAVAEINSAISLQFRSFSAQLEESLLRERMMATLSGGFAVLAVLLATLGLYGVIAYMVARRRNEIGVRIALGADRTRVIALILRETLLLLVVGLAAGLLIALWAGRGAASILYGLQPYDPASIAASIALLASIAIAAGYIPARRAAALEPMAALRDE